METILLILSYYLALAMVMCIYSGFKDNSDWAYASVLWPLYMIITLIVLLGFGIFFIGYLFFGLFYKFGGMFK